MTRLNTENKSALITLAVQVVSKVMKGTLVPALLGPANYGSLSIISTLSRVSRLLDVGAQATLMTYGAKELDKNEHSFRRYHSIFSSWFVAFIFALTIVTISYSYLNGIKFYLALLIIIFIASSRIRELVQNMHQINGRYIAAYTIQTWFSIYSLFLIPIGGYFFDWIGVLIGTVVSEILATTMKFVRPLHLSVGTLLPKRFLPNQSKMFVLNGYDIIHGNIDYFVYFSIFSIADYGKFAFGTIILWIYELIYDVISTQYVPEIAKVNDEDKVVKTRILFDSLIKPFMFLTVAGALLMPHVINLFFEDYRDFIEVYLLMFAVGAIRTYIGIVKRFYVSKMDHLSYFLRGSLYPAGMLLLLMVPFKLTSLEVILSILILNIIALLALAIGKRVLSFNSLSGLSAIIFFTMGLSIDRTIYLVVSSVFFFLSLILNKRHVVI